MQNLRLTKKHASSRCVESVRMSSSAYVPCPPCWRSKFCTQLWHFVTRWQWSHPPSSTIWWLCKRHLVVLFGLKEHQISELMKHSGDSSEQLSLMNQQLVEKDRLVSSSDVTCDVTHRHGVTSSFFTHLVHLGMASIHHTRFVIVSTAVIYFRW